MREVKRKDLDPVTGLLNKTAFLKALEDIISDSHKIKDQILAYCNICHFSYYNIRYDGRSGNQVLKDLGNFLSFALPIDASRFDSDHFVMIIDKEDCREKIEAIIAQFNDTYAVKGLSLKIGLFELQEGIDAEHSCELVKLACDSIRNSQDDYYFYNAKISEHARMETYIISNIDRAISEQWIQVYYQPVIRTINSRLCGVEALARWIDPKRDMISPGVFIPVLEDNQLITKLDLYMLEKVCQSLHEASKKYIKIVPVSINLSRMDFLSCDIFRKVEDCVQKYHIARDYLNIEVTESMVMEDTELLKRELMRFRNAGYEVWMDDFGSGYSSLNVLSEYEFDEIKLDMVFLRKFDEKSKRVIRSVISMARQLGTRTLVEGVETKEQYEFLRAIGCEKVQGFYFSAPVPKEKMYEMYHDRSYEVETRLEKHYYAKVQSVDFMTKRPIGIEDYDGHDFHLLYCNQRYIEIWKETGVHTKEDREHLLNDEHSIHYSQYRHIINRLEEDGKPLHVEVDTYGNLMTLSLRQLSQINGHILIAIEVLDTMINTHKKTTNENYIYRTLSLIYDGIYLIHRTNNQLETIRPGTNHQLIMEQYKENHEQISMKLFKDVFISPQDQKEYEEFARLDTLQARIEKRDRNYITKMFLTKVANGAYVFKLHTLQLVPDTDYVLYSIQDVPLLYRQLVRKNQEISADFNEKIFESEVWQALMKSKHSNLFVKDADRRFISVNAQFLKTYGLKDQKEVLGKTDEDMNWNIDRMTFKDDELDVLERGVSIVNYVGKCIINSTVHNILVNKIPIYHEGKIIGLVGSFIDLNNLPVSIAKMRGTYKQSSLMSLEGISQIIGDYMEGWEYRQEKFAAISVQFSAYLHAASTYGHKIAHAMLIEMEQLMGKFCANRAIASRIYGERFLILYKYQEREDVNMFTKELSDYFEEIRSLAHHPETLNPEVHAYLIEDEQNVKDLMLKATSGINLRINEQRNIDEHLLENHINTEEIIHDLPGGIVLGEVVNGEYKIIYASESLSKSYGYSVAELKTKVNRDHNMLVVKEDEPLVRKAAYEAGQKGEGFEVTFRAKRKDDSIFWMRQESRLIATHNGHPVIIGTFQNLSENDEVFYRILDSSQEGMIVRDASTKEIFYVNRMVRAMAQHAVIHASLEELCQLLFNVGEGKAQFEQAFGNSYLKVRLLKSKWYGRNCEVCYLIDLTLQHKKNENMREILSHVPAGIAMFSVSQDYEIRCLYLSEQAKKYGHVDYRSDESLTELLATVYEDDREELRLHIIEAVKKQEICDLEFRIYGDDGKIYWDRLMLCPYIQEDGTYLLYGVYSDLTELHHQKDVLKQQSRTDVLTGLLNRQALEEDYKQLIGHSLTLYMLDVDHFKMFNDQFGHLTGDLVISTCGKKIHDDFQDCYNYRYGGDEFIIISTKDNLKDMQKRMNSFMHDIKQLDLGHNIPEVAITYGRLEGHPQSREELIDLFKKVDRALYEMKTKRHNGKH